MQKIIILKNLLIFSFLMFLLSILSINNYSTVVLEGIKLFTNCVLPSIFPYLVTVSIINKLNLNCVFGKLFSPLSKKVFNTNGNVLTAFIISLISGYPIGAKIISDLRKDNLISSAESVRGAILCSTSSPAFLIATVGRNFYENTKIGVIILLSQISSSIILGFVFSFYKRKEKATDIIIKPKKYYNVINESIEKSVFSILTIGGTITIFFLLSVLLYELKILSPFIFVFEKVFKSETLAKGLTIGILECTSGLSILSTNKNVISISLASLLCGFGGLSIIMQSITFLKSAKIKTAPFLISKIISAVLNFIFTYFFCLIFL